MTETSTASHDAPAPAPPKGRLDRLADLVAPPARTLGSRGTILAPLVLVFCISLVSSFAVRAWASSAPPDSGAALLLRSGSLVWLLSLAAPVAAALKGVVFAAMAWGILVLLGGTPAVRPLLSTLFYGEAILSVQALWLTAGALLLEAPPPQAPGAMPIPSGLDAWVGSGGGAFLALAQQVTPFHLAWIAFLTVAFSARAGVSWRRGGTAALLLWGLSTGLAILRTSTV